MNRTHAPLSFALLTGLCVVGLLLAGCGKEDPPPRPATIPAIQPSDVPSSAPDAPDAPDVPALTDEQVLASYPIQVCVSCEGRLGDNKVVARRGKSAIVACSKACADKYESKPAE